MVQLRREREERKTERKRKHLCRAEIEKKLVGDRRSLCKKTEMSASDDDFVDVAAVAASSSLAGGGGFGDGNDALRALSGHLDGGAMMSSSASASTSSQQPAAPAPLPHHSSRRSWFSSLFGGGGAFPAAVQAARSRTVRERRKSLERRERERERELKERGKNLGKKLLRCPISLALTTAVASFTKPLSLSFSSLFPPTGHQPPGPLVSSSIASLQEGRKEKETLRNSSPPPPPKKKKLKKLIKKTLNSPKKR